MTYGVVFLTAGFSTIFLVGTTAPPGARAPLLLVGLVAVAAGAGLILRELLRQSSDGDPAPLAASRPPRHPRLRVVGILIAVGAVPASLTFIAGPVEGIVAIVTVTLIVGGLLALNHYRARGLPRAARWSVSHSRTYAVAEQKDDAVQQVAKTLADDPHLRVSSSSPTCVRASLPASLARMNGVDISVTVEEHRGTTVICVATESSIAILLDGGDSWRALDRVDSAIRRRLHLIPGWAGDAMGHCR